MNRNVTIIGVVGLAGSGKNTVAEMLRQAGETVTTISFAARLKWVAKHEFGWDGKKDARGRKLLQEVGEAARKYSPLHWVRCLEGDYTVYRAASQSLFVVTDVRFKNEAKWIREHGGVIWRVERDGAGLKGELGKDASETEQASIKADLVLQNNADLHSFGDEVVLAYRDLVGGKLEVEV